MEDRRKRRKGEVGPSKDVQVQNAKERSELAKKAATARWKSVGKQATLLCYPHGRN